MKKIFILFTAMIIAGSNSANAQQPGSTEPPIDKGPGSFQNNTVSIQNNQEENFRIAEEYRSTIVADDSARAAENIKQAAAKGPQVYHAVVNNKYAYISIPSYAGQTDDQMAGFAQRIQDSLYEVITETTEGILIDLRLNAGGNIFPMFAGLSNVLGDDDVAIYADSNGKIVDRTSIQKNNVLKNGKVITSLIKNYGDFSRFPVAIVIGPLTSGTGESLAAGFIGRRNTALIGEATAGHTLAAGYVRDRFGNAYYKKIIPDVEIKAGDDFFNHCQDKKIQAAACWLEKQK